VPGGGAATGPSIAIAGGQQHGRHHQLERLYTAGVRGRPPHRGQPASPTRAQTAAATVAVTDLAGVYTYHNDPVARWRGNTQDYRAHHRNVAASLGKLAPARSDGRNLRQPAMGGERRHQRHDAQWVYVATPARPALFAFRMRIFCHDLHAALEVSLVDAGAWRKRRRERRFPLHTDAVPARGLPWWARGYGDIQPDRGDGHAGDRPVAGILYVVSKSVKRANDFLSAAACIDLTTGSEKAGSPVAITATSSRDGGRGTTVAFNTQHENQPPGLGAPPNGNVYIAWAAHEDVAPGMGGSSRYHLQTSTFIQSARFTHGAQRGARAECGMSGGAPAVDFQRYVYVSTGKRRVRLPQC